MMRDLHLGVRLPFESVEEQHDSEEILHLLLNIICRLNRQYLRRNPNTKALYESGVRYSPPGQVRAPVISNDRMLELTAMLKRLGLSPESGLMVCRIARGVETFLDIPSLYQRGHGDCNELVPVRVAELWRAGILARPYLTVERNDRGGLTYHAIVQWPDGSAEDPSLILGMGGPERAADRAEEIRKNKERLGNYIAAAQQLVASEGADPADIARSIDLMGLLPKGGYGA